MQRRTAQLIAILTSAMVFSAGERLAQTGTHQVRVTDVTRISRVDLYLVNADRTLGQNLTRTLENGGTDPSFSRDCRKIAFLSSSDIYVMDVNGSNIRQLTKCDCYGAVCDAISHESPQCLIQSPIFSPDGDRILFNRSESHPSNEDFKSGTTIWVMDANGSGERPLTDMLEQTRYRADPWSPDGSKLIFESEDDLFVADADGSNVRRLTETSDTAKYPVEDWRNVASAGTSWSRDGTMILFASQRTGNMEVWSMEADGSNQSQLTHTSADTTHYPVAWSPDGRQILFNRFNTWADMDVAVMDADGSNVRTLVSFNSEGPLGALRWTDNGIEYHPGRIWESPGGYIMDRDGTNLRRTGSVGDDAVCPW